MKKPPLEQPKIPSIDDILGRLRREVVLAPVFRAMGEPARDDSDTLFGALTDLKLVAPVMRDHAVIPAQYKMSPEEHAAWARLTNWATGAYLKKPKKKPAPKKAKRSK